MGRKFTYEFVRDYFEEQGCELLEKEYKSNSTKMKYRCKCGRRNKITFANFKKGRRCRKCGNKNRIDPQKYTFEFVRQYFEEQGCKLLEKKYINCKTKMKYRCNCGNISKIKFSEFKTGHRCKECVGERNAKQFSFTYKFVRNYFEEQGCEMLDTFYKNARTHINYRCSCGEVSKIIFDSFRRGHRCRKCATAENSKKQTFSYKYVYDYFKDHGCELLEVEYINAQTKMRYKCSCGDISFTNLNNFKNRKRCAKCGVEK